MSYVKIVHNQRETFPILSNLRTFQIGHFENCQQIFRIFFLFGTSSLQFIMFNPEQFMSTLAIANSLICFYSNLYFLLFCFFLLVFFPSPSSLLFLLLLLRSLIFLVLFSYFLLLPFCSSSLLNLLYIHCVNVFLYRFLNCK